MVIVNIFVIVMAVKHVVDAELETEALVELVVRGEVHKEVSIPCLEVAAFLACFRPVGNKHAVQVDGPGILIVGGSQMEQVVRNVVVLTAFNLAYLPGFMLLTLREIEVSLPQIYIMIIIPNGKTFGE